MSRNLFNLSQKNKSALLKTVASLVFFVLVFGVIAPLPASATVYQPGATLEPDCAPGSANCGVATFSAELGTSTPIGNSLFTIAATSTNSILATLRAFAGQVANLFQVQNSAGTNVFTIDSTGTTTVGTLDVSSTLNLTGTTVSGLSFNQLTDTSTLLSVSNNNIFTNTNTFNSSLVVSGNMFASVSSDYVTTGSQNNVNLGTGSNFRYAGTADASFSGIAGGTSGRIIYISNLSVGHRLTIKNQSGSSLAANQIVTPTGADLTLLTNYTIGLMYDSGSGLWQVISTPTAASTINSFAFINGGNGFGSAASLGTTDATGLNFLTSGTNRFSVATSSATFIGNGVTTLTSNSTLAITSAGGSALSVTASSTGALALDSGTTGAINIGTSSFAKIITIGNTTGATTLNIKSGTGGINLIGLVTITNASTTALNVLSNIIIGSTATSTLVGDNGLSILKSDLLVTGSTTLQNFLAINGTTTGSFYSNHFIGDGQNITLARIGSSTFSTLQDLQNVFHSAGWTSGGAVTDNGNGTVSVTAGTGLLRSLNSATATVFYADWSASANISIPTDTIRYLGVEYNGGSPRVTLRTSEDWNYKTDFPLARISNEVGENHITNDVQGVGDHAASMIRREFETMPLALDQRDGGLMLSESGDGNRYINLTAGTLWDRLNRFSIGEVSTSPGGGNTFEPYLEGVEIHPETTTWDNLHYDNGNVVTTMTDNDYAVLWFHVITDGSLTMTYGTNQYTSLAAATVETEPTDLLANDIKAGGKLVGRLIFKKGATTAAEVDSAFGMTTFNSTALTHLSNLTGLDYADSGLIGFVAGGGVSGGQTIIGGTTSTDGLALQSTSATGTTDFIKFLVGTNGNLEVARITHDGNFGIGTSTPSTKLYVIGTTTAANFITYSTSSISSFAGPVAMSSTLSITGIATLGGLTVSGNTSLQNLTAVTSTFFNASTTNFSVSSTSQLGTIVSGLWNGTVIGSGFGGTGQSSWTKGDILYASADNFLARLPIGSNGTILTVGGGGVPTWAANGGGGGGSGTPWATSTNDLFIFPAIPTQIVVVGSSNTTSLGLALNAILEVNGNTLLSGTTTVTGFSALNGGVSTTNATISGSLFIGGNATTTASGAFSTNGLITAAAAGTGLSVTNNASIGGLATITNILSAGTTTLQYLTATNSVFANVSSTNLFATNFSTNNFSPANLSTNGTLTVVGGATLADATSTGNVFVSGTLFIGGFTTTTNGTVNTQTKFQIAGADALTVNTLGSGIVNSSLTSVGTLGSLTVSGLSLLGVVSTTGNVTVSGSLFIGGNATTSANGNFATNGTITSGLINSQTISSAANFTGSLTVASLVTASNGLTLSSGTLTLPNVSIADAALSANVALLNRNGQTFSGTNTFSALTTLAGVSTTQLTVSGDFGVSGNVATPKGADYSTTGSQNDVSLGSGSLFRYTGVSAATFTGIAGGTDGRIISIINSSTFSLKLTNNDSNSTAANRIITTLGATITIPTNFSVTLQYDAGVSRWHVMVLPAVATAFINGGNGFGVSASIGTTDANGLALLTSGSVRFLVATTSATFSGNGATTLTSNSTLDISSAAGASISLDSGTTGSLSIGTSTNAKTITIGNTTSTTALVLNSGTGGITLTGSTTIAGVLTLATTTITNGTSTNFFSTGLTFTNLSGTNVTSTNLNVTGLTFTNLTGTNATSTNLNVSGLTNLASTIITNVTSTNLNISGLNNLGGTTLTTLLATSVTSTNLNVSSLVNLANTTITNGTSTNFFSTSLTFTNLTGTNATSTNLNTTNFTASRVTTTNLSVNGQNVCLVDGTNCPTPRPSVKTASSTASVILSTTETNLLTVTTTPSNTSSQIWIVASANTVQDNSQNYTFTIRIRRDGATCASGTQIGVDMSVAVLKNAALPGGAVSVSFVDSPSTTAAVAYHICGLNSAGTANTSVDKSITVEEVKFGADLAEVYNSSDGPLAPGEVVELDPAGEGQVRRTTGAYSTAALGVISTRPGMLLSNPIIGAGSPVTVALSGRVPVKVSSENGAILPGDYLTAASIPGVAMKATKFGPVIGQALTGYQSDSVVGTVVMFVKNGYYDIGGINVSTSTPVYSLGLVPILLGEISPEVRPSSTDNGLATFISTVQTEVAHDPIVVLSAKITAGTRFVTDFVSARVTAIRGYFDEIFAKKIHTEQLCIKKTDGGEVCINGDQVNALLQNNNLAPINTTTAAAPPIQTPPPADSSSTLATTAQDPTTTPVIDPAPQPAPPPAVGQSTSSTSST